jgi:membrane protease YdiL (CAAX protease family)
MSQPSLTPELPSRENDATNVPSASSVTSQRIDPIDVPQYGFLKLLMLHLAPGALCFLVYLALVPLAVRLHLPTFSALLLAVAIALLPLEMGHLLLQGKRRNGRWSLEGIVLYQQDWRGSRYLLTVPGLCILSIAGFALSAPLDRFWQHAAFSWLPAWFVFSDVRQYAQFSRSVLIIVFSARLLLDGFLGPIVEELYFRGYLLPRMSRFGWAAPFLNCALFAVYHFWQPYNLPSLFFVSLPIVFGVWKTKNVRVGIYTHILLNTIGGTLALIAVLHHA